MAQPAPKLVNSQAFPSMNTPLILPDGGGGPNAPWYLFFTNLWNRTGGSQGVDGTTVVQAIEDNALLLAITMGLTGV